MLPGFFVVLSAFRFAQKSPRVRKTHRLQKVKRPPQLAAAFMAFRFAQKSPRVRKTHRLQKVKRLPKLAAAFMAFRFAQIEVRRIKELTDKPFA